MPVTNLAPILAPAPEAPNPFGRDRETGADGFALLLAFLAGAPAASGEAPATSSSPAGGADSSVASRAVGPGLVSAGAASAFAAEIVSGGDTVADRGLGVPARESAASGGPALPAAAGAPFEAVSAATRTGPVLSGPQALPSEPSAGFLRSWPSLGLSSADPDGRGPLSGLELPTVASAGAMPSALAVRGIRPEGVGAALPPAGVDPSLSGALAEPPRFEPTSPTVSGGEAEHPASYGGLAAEHSLSRSARAAAAVGDVGPGAPLDSVAAAVEPDAAALGRASGALADPAGSPGERAAAVGSERSGVPADPSALRPMPSATFHDAARASGAAESNGRSPRAAAAAPAGGGDPEARVPQPVAAADPAGSPGERVAAAGSVKVAVSGARTSGGSAEAGVGDGSKSPVDPGSPLDRAEADSAPVLDPPPLPEPAPAGRSAEPLVPPRVPSVPVPQPPAVQVAATLLQRDGVPIERLRIALEPAELGSVELTLTSEGRRKVRAVVLVERPETLELLQRDQGTLERILVASGLELEAGGLEFGLRRDDQGRPEPFVPSPHASGPGGPGRSAAAPTPPRSLDLRLLDLVV